MNRHFRQKNKVSPLLDGEVKIANFFNSAHKKLN
jgi:hypothetical protein